jgi:NADH-ubiquinone oxidoreductase chain 6
MLYNIININILNNNILLDIIGILSIITALLIIIVANPMYSILYLIFLFVYISIYLYLIGISIMSLLYLLVYIGAIAVLFLFILSLLNNKEPSFENENINNKNILLYNKDEKSIPFILLIVYYLYNNTISSLNNLNIILPSDNNNKINYDIINNNININNIINNN